jgi:hypothetical protein
MSQPPTESTYPLARWVGWVGSVLILFHLASVVVGAMAAQSGPWPNPQTGPTMVAPPRFVVSLFQSVPGEYLKAIQMTSNYHFPTNRPGLPDITFEVRLKDEKGNVIDTVRFPDENANFYVRHRQELLANALGGDEGVSAPPTEIIPPPGQEVPKVLIWVEGAREQKLKRENPNLLLRNQMYMGPSETSMLFARSFVRYLCRTHGAASGELIRHHREPIGVDVLFMETVPQGIADEIHSNFGEFPK